MAIRKSGAHRIEPDQPMDLASIDPDPPPDLDRDESESARDRDLERLVELQQRLSAEERHGLLVILLGVDTSGKDETIQDVFGVLDLRSARAVKFGAPSETEQKHDFLWRVHAATPGHGEIVIFNRSHYDDMTEPWVAGEIDHAELQQRCEHARNFERLLTDSGISILKLFFHISRDEQAKRILERLETPERQHEFSPADIGVQEQWDQYWTVFEQLLAATSTDSAPWFVIPSNAAWFRSGVAARFPAPVEDIEQYREKLDAARRA
jgi:polyphosphate kinase 2 (PPK2 family)